MPDIVHVPGLSEAAKEKKGRILVPQTLLLNAPTLAAAGTGAAILRHAVKQRNDDLDADKVPEILANPSFGVRHPYLIQGALGTLSGLSLGAAIPLPQYMVPREQYMHGKKMITGAMGALGLLGGLVSARNTTNENLANEELSRMYDDSMGDTTDMKKTILRRPFTSAAKAGLYDGAVTALGMRLQGGNMRGLVPLSAALGAAKGFQGGAAHQHTLAKAYREGRGLPTKVEQTKQEEEHKEAMLEAMMDGFIAAAAKHAAAYDSGDDDDVAGLDRSLDDTTRRRVYSEMDTHEGRWSAHEKMLRAHNKELTKQFQNGGKWTRRLRNAGAYTGFIGGGLLPFGVGLLAANKFNNETPLQIGANLAPLSSLVGLGVGAGVGHALGNRLDDGPARQALQDRMAEARNYVARARSEKKNRKPSPMSNALEQEIQAFMAEKHAALKTPLLEHQQRVVDRIKDPSQPGLVVVHGLGSGKTLSSIAAQDALGMDSTVVVPAALQDNYTKERKKHLTGDTPEAHVTSMQNAASKRTLKENPLLIVDEAHRARDPQSKTYKTLAANTAEKRLMLTASPFYNHPADLSGLINLAAGREILPADQNAFSAAFTRDKLTVPNIFLRMRGVQAGITPELNPRSAPFLRKTYGKWVDYHAGSKEGFPEVRRQNVEVDMTPQQLRVYDAMLGKAPPWVAMKVRAGLPPSKQEAGELNTFMNAVRQVSNTTAGFSTDNPHAPKIQKAFEELQNHLKDNARGKALIYSNYLESGINPYKALLDKHKIPYGEYTGDIDKETRDQLVRDYNEDKLKALLVSSAGGEGLDLKGTRLIQVLDPHWNNEKIRQVEGRGIRYKSHDHLPEEERNVTIQNFLAKRPRSGLLEKLHVAKPGFSADEYLTQRSADKDKLISQFKELLPVAEKTK